MTQSVSNVRVRRTQKLLREALIELIEERGFEALTVGELTKRALVSRAAFYRNYQDKYDLVEQIFEEAMSALLEAVGELGADRKSTRLNSSHLVISYAVFCLKKKKQPHTCRTRCDR